MILDFNIVGLLFIGYFVHFTYGGGGKHEKVHVKIHVPEIVKHHHHTKVVFVHKPHHKPEPKKPLVVHHHHHHKHDHGHKHKHGHNHGHKHQHGHKHNHKHKHNLYHHHEKVPHHHHHYKKNKYVTNEHVVDHYPVNGYRYQKSRNERYHTHSFAPLVRPNPNYYESESNYKVKENGYDFTTSGYDLPPYPQLSSLVNPDVEYVGQNENTYEDSRENLSEDLNHDAPADYASNEYYEHLREPLHEEGYFDYEEETNKRLVGPDGQVLVTKTLTVGDKNGRHVSHSTEVV